MHESDVFRRVFKGLTKAIYLEKTSNPWRRGTPDYYLEAPRGRTMWVETKIHPNKTTRLQARWISRARKHGQTVWVVTRKPDKTFEVETGESVIRNLRKDGLLRVIEHELGVYNDGSEQAEGPPFATSGGQVQDSRAQPGAERAQGNTD